jgi:hypothetical protein
MAAIALTSCGSNSNSDQTEASGSGNPLTLDWEAVGLFSPPVVTFSLGLLGTVSPPTVSSSVLEADDVMVVGTTAYVSYNLGGNTVAGAIEQITNVASTPLLGALAPLPSLKVNGLFLNGTDLYAVGASSGSDGPAVIKKYSVPSNLIPTTLTQTATKTLGSYAGVGVLMRGSSVYAVSGDDAVNGGVTILDSNLNQTAFTAIQDARGISYSSLGTGDMFVIAAQPGRIVELSTAGSVVRTIPLGGGVTPQSKSTITGGKTMLIATVGEGGARVVCQADHQILASISAPVISGTSASLTVTNAIAAAQGLLFVANGEAGVYVYSMKDSAPTTSSCDTVSVTLLGSINLGSGLSANNVKYANGVLYVANGLGGFRLISVVSLPSANDNTDFI